jgi:hypothetical protein
MPVWRATLKVLKSPLQGGDTVGVNVPSIKTPVAVAVIVPPPQLPPSSWVAARVTVLPETVPLIVPKLPLS